MEHQCCDCRHSKAPLPKDLQQHSLHCTGERCSVSKPVSRVAAFSLLQMCTRTQAAHHPVKVVCVGPHGVKEFAPQQLSLEAGGGLGYLGLSLLNL